ncbi:MAG: hypothetical protein HKO01_07480 [Flaviramulus sp.]|nr:hypothetical protein [Flaviramulus sp.]NNC50359.1 hypothetical protein [Flaviramulus sp.]
MKKTLILIASIVFVLSSYAQVSYLQYRIVPSDRDAEFVEKETKYWSKVAKAAANQGNLLGWTLWRKVGVTKPDAPNYVFVNTYESLDKMDPSKIWTDDNVKSMGVDPASVETNSFTTIAFDCYLNLEATAGGAYQYAVVNYAKPTSRADFIEENKTLWKPLHEKNIESGTMGISSWGLMSVITPTGNEARFSCLTWDGFPTLTDALKYVSYSSPDSEATGPFQDVLSKTKMDEIMPHGFEYSIIYERVMSVRADKK